MFAWRSGWTTSRARWEIMPPWRTETAATRVDVPFLHRKKHSLSTRFDDQCLLEGAGGLHREHDGRSCHPEGLRLLRLGLMFFFYTERNIVFPLDLMIIVCLKARVDYIESTMGDSTAASSPPPSPGLEQETERKTRRNGDRKEPLRLVAKRCMMTTSLKRDGPWNAAAIKSNPYSTEKNEQSVFQILTALFGGFWWFL